MDCDSSSVQLKDREASGEIKFTPPKTNKSLLSGARWCVMTPKGLRVESSLIVMYETWLSHPGDSSNGNTDLL